MPVLHSAPNKIYKSLYYPVSIILIVASFYIIIRLSDNHPPNCVRKIPAQVCNKANDQDIKMSDRNILIN